MKKIIAVLVIATFVFGYSAFASQNEPLKKLSKGLNNVLYGTVEIPDSVNETGTKGTKAFKDCTESTKSDVGRGIARIVGGLWEIATFWYPSD